MNVGLKKIPEIDNHELKHALEQMKKKYIISKGNDNRSRKFQNITNYSIYI